MVGPHRLPCETPEGQRQGEAAAPSRWVLPATILGSSLSFIDGSVVGVALPAIGAALRADLAQLQWVVNGYMLSFASLILLGGAAGDRFGQRRVFLIGLGAFTLASAGCGLAPDAGWLIALRIAQGAAAALLVPASLALIGAAYRGAARGKAIGTWAAAGALTTALGPVLGGWLVDSVDWRAIFFINLPLGVLALALATRLPRDAERDAHAPLDLVGAALAVAALGLASFGLIALGEGQAGGWALAAALPALLLFLWVERRAPAPMMPLDLFANRDFAGANLLTLMLYAALSGALFLLPFTLIEVHDYSATAAGAAFLPFSIIMGLGSRATGGLVERLGARTLLMIGPAVTASGFALLGLTSADAAFLTGVLPGLVLIAIGMTLNVAPLTTTVLNAAPDARGGVASGINNAAARAAGLLAVAALGLAFGGAASADSLDRERLLAAYRMVMFAAAALALGAAGVAALMLGPKAPSR